MPRHWYNRCCRRFVNISHSCQFCWPLGGPRGKSWFELVYRWARNVANSSHPSEHSQKFQSEAVWVLPCRFLQCSSVGAVQRRWKYRHYFRYALQHTQVDGSYETRLEVRWWTSKARPMRSFQARIFCACCFNLNFFSFRLQQSRYEKAMETTNVHDRRLHNAKTSVWKEIKALIHLIAGNDFCSDVCYQKNASQWINEVQEKSLIQSLRYLRDTSPRYLNDWLTINMTEIKISHRYVASKTNGRISCFFSFLPKDDR